MSWKVAYIMLGFAYDVWTVTYILRTVLRRLGHRPPAAVNWVFFEFRPFFPVLCVAVFLAGALSEGAHGAGWRAITLLFGLINWWFSRRDKDDDDRWKRRRKALSARIAELGGRLAVVPA